MTVGTTAVNEHIRVFQKNLFFSYHSGQFFIYAP